MSIADDLAEMKRKYEAQALPEKLMGGIKKGHKYDLNRHGYLHSVQHPNQALASLLKGGQPTETAINERQQLAGTVDYSRRPQHGESPDRRQSPP